MSKGTYTSNKHSMQQNESQTVSNESIHIPIISNLKMKLNG